MSDAPAPLYRLTLSQVTGLLLYSQRTTLVFTGTIEELKDHYRGVTRHNVLLGWWGFPVGLIWNAIALTANARALRDLQALVE